jgi:hypothetical protein
MVSRLPSGRSPAALDFYNLYSLIGNGNSREPEPQKSLDLDPSWSGMKDLYILRNSLDICSRWTGGHNAVRILVISLQFRSGSTPRNLWPHTLLVLSDVGFPPNPGPSSPWAAWSPSHQHIFIKGPDLREEKLEWISVVNSEIYVPGEYETTYQFGQTLVRHYWTSDPCYGAPSITEIHERNSVWPHIKRQRHRGPRDDTVCGFILWLIGYD